jgi:hypothetical protein
MWKLFITILIVGFAVQRFRVLAAALIIFIASFVETFFYAYGDPPGFLFCAGLLYGLSATGQVSYFLSLFVRRRVFFGRRWRPAATAPFERDIELAVIDTDGMRCLVFPCRRTEDGWQNARTGLSLDVAPTHWRNWQDDEI